MTKFPTFLMLVFSLSACTSDEISDLSPQDIAILAVGGVLTAAVAASGGNSNDFLEAGESFSKALAEVDFQNNDFSSAPSIQQDQKRSLTELSNTMVNKETNLHSIDEYNKPGDSALRCLVLGRKNIELGIRDVKNICDYDINFNYCYDSDKKIDSSLNSGYCRKQGQAEIGFAGDSAHGRGLPVFADWGARLEAGKTARISLSDDPIRTMACRASKTPIYDFPGYGFSLVYRDYGKNYTCREPILEKYSSR